MLGFLKRYADAGRAQEALRRTRALRRHSVQTPAAQPGPDATTLVFDRIAGQTGRALIGLPMAPLLRALSGLHAARVPDLPTYDPLLRIRTRLELTNKPLLREIADGPVPTGRAVLHGDLHVGQFVVEPSGAVWLVDLDDMAIGPPEADLANFAAHLATTMPAPGIAACAGEVCRAWAKLGGALDPEVFRRYLHLSLLRRHLKLREAARPDFEAEILAYLRESASFSMR